jgi:type I restriction enzyme S subunit
MVAEGYKETEIGVIPVDWKVEKIENLLEKFQNGYAFSSKGYKEKGIPIVSMASISLDGKFQFNYEKAKYWDSEKLDELEAFTLKKNDLIIAMTDVTPDKKLIGRMAIVDIDDTFLLNQRVGLLKLKNNINYIFLSNYSNHTKWRSYSKNISALGAQANLSTKDIKEAKIPLPPLKEQEKIADILSTADAKIDAIAIQIDRAETLKKGLLQKLLSEGIGHSEFKDSELGKIPESWEVVKLEDISDFITKGATPTTYGFDWEETGIPFLRSECVSDNGLVMKAAMFISDEAHKHMNRSEIKNGDLLMTITGNVGRVILLQDDISIGNINQHIARIRISSNQVDNKFMYQYLSQDKYRLNYYKITTGQAYPQISLKQVRNSIVPLPSLKEQKQIADILSAADEKLEVLRAKKEKCETLKKGLLQKLLSGEVRV